ncbi:uncharacterized protein LOC124496507 isoform X2 [Dermatophagoides farinae]|uniref:uncharacterized protein LOC124496507 isoform X2 n=1 Tax=Dermatophagoides farinae TaxID=6954 RepID=UPI003F5DF18D
MTGKDIGDDHQFGFPSFRFKLPEFGWQSLDSVEKDVKKPKKIIRIILKTPNGHETIDDQYIDPDTDVKQVEKLLMEKIHSKLSDVPDSQTKIIGKIIDLKPGDKETIEEFELDSDIAKKDLKNVLEQTPRTKTTKQKDPLGRIITKIFRRKPDGKETIEEHLEDPKETGRDIGDDTLGFPSFKIKMPEFGWRSDSVEKDSKKPKKILRIVLRKPDGNEIVDDLLVDPQTSPKDVDRMIKERIKAKLPEIKDSNTMIIGKVIDLKPGDEEKIEEFEADLESAKKNLDDAIKRAPKQKTIKKKDSLGKIITKIFRRKPDGKETIEEFVEDPKQTAQLDKFRTEIPELILHKQIDDPKKPRKIIRVLIQKPNGDESIEDVVVDLKTNPKDVDKISKDLLQKKLPEIKEPNAKIICKIIDLKPGEEETTEEFETDTEMARKNLEDAMKKAPRKKTTKKKDPLGKIITKIFKRKPDGKEMVEEFVEDPKITGREIGDETMGVPDKFKIKKPELFSKSGDDDHDKAKQKQPKKIIRIILRKPNGDEQVEDLHIDPGTSGKDVEKAIKDEIQKKLPQIKDPNMKIISKIIDTKPGEEESVEEFETDPETARKNLDDAIKKAPRTKTSKKKDSLGKIITKVFKRKPDGKETVEEFIEDPKVTGKDIGDDDTIGKLPEELKKEMPEVFGKPHDEENIREKRPKKIIRIILRKPNGDESIEDIEVDHATSPKDVDKAIKEAIQKKLPDIKDPKTQIVSKVIDTKPDEEETTDEFETDPETARKNLDDVMEKAPRKKTTKKKDPLGKIITKIFKRKPDGKETVEEFIEDPKMTGKDIGDDDMPKPISESVTRMTDPTGKTTTRIVREMPDGTKSTQEIIEEPEKKVTTEKLESIERKPEKEKSAATELSKRPKSPKDDPAKQKSAILRKSKSPEKPDVDTKKKKSKKIIRVVLRKPNGEESIEDVDIDQKATPKDVDKAMKDALKRKLSQIKDPKTKIITQIIDSKPGEMESIEEFETDPEIVKKNLNDVLKKAVLTKITKNKDPSGKIRIQIFKRKPDGKEIHEEYVEDPKVTGKDIGDDDTLGKLPDELQKKMSEIMGKFDGKIQEPEKKDEPHHHPEKVKSSIPEVSSKKPDSPKQKPSTLPEMLKSSDVADDEHSKQKKSKKIIRIILRKPNGDEQVEDLLIDTDTKPEDVDETIKKELRKSLNKIDDPVNAKIITKIIDKKPGEEETTEEFETDSESVKKNLDEVMKKAPRTKITKRKDPFGKIITKILRRKPNGEEETVEEFIEDPKQTGKDIGDDDDIDRLRIEPKISTQPAKRIDDSMGKMPKKIIRIILRKPNGDESVEQLFLDPSTRPEDVDDTMKEEIQNVMNKIDDPNTRIIFKIIDSKPCDEESIEEFETDPESLKTNINEAIRKLPRTKTNRKKNQMGKIVTKIFRRKPDGKEEIIDEFVEDPKQTGKDIGDDDIPKPIIESMSKLVDPTGSRPLDSEMAKMPEILKRFDVKEQREKRPKKIIRIILRKPNGDESIEDVEINPATSPKDVDKAIKDAIQKKLPDINDPKTQIVSKVIDTKPGEEETTEEFETDPETARKNLDDVMEKAPRKKTTKKKDPLGKIITKIFKRKPDGKETVEEFVEDPKVTGKDIGDDAMPKPISESVTRMTDPTGKTTTRIVREMPDGTKSIQEIIEEPEKKDELKPKKMEGRHDEKPSPKDTVDNVLGQFSDQPSKETIRTLEELSKPLPDDIREGEQKSTKTTPTAVMEKPFGSITMSTDHPSQLPSFEPMDTKATTKTSSIDKPTKSATAAPTLISPQKPIIDDNKEQKQVTQSMLPDVEKFADPDKMIIVAEQKEPQIQQKKHAEQTKELPRQSSAITGDDDDEWIKCLQSEIVHEDIEKEKVKKVMETASKPLEKKSVKVVLMKPDGQETMEEVEIDSHTDPRDMNEAVKKVLQKLLPKAKEIPMTKIVARLCRQKSTDECIEEFETDVDNLNNIENFDEIIKNIPKTTIKRIKDPRGNIITRVIKEDPDGTKLIEESIDDPKTPAGHIDPVCEEIIRPKRFVPKFYDDNDEGILNPIVEELPMDEESDKRIFDEPSKKPDMKESSSVKPAPKPEDTKDDNKESETKPIDEKAVPKDLSVSADIKEPQKLVAGVIYDDDDNEEKIEKPIDDIGSSKHSGDITTDQHPEKVETQKADNLIEKDQKSLNDDGSISMKPEKESFIKPDNQTKPGDKTIVTGISTTEKPLNDQTATTAQPDDKKSSNLLKPGDDKISSSELSKKAVDEMMKPSDKPEDQIHLKPMDDVKESTKTKQEKFEEIKVSKSENKKPEILDKPEEKTESADDDVKPIDDGKKLDKPKDEHAKQPTNQIKTTDKPFIDDKKPDSIEIQSKDLISIPSDDESRKKPADDKPTKADEEKPKKPDDKSDNSKSISQPIVETIVADQKPVKDFSKVSSKTVKDEPKQIKSDEPSIGHDDGDKRKPSKQLEQPEIIKRTALNEPEQLKKQEPISSDGRQIDPKSLNEFKDVFDEMAGKKPQSCIPQQTSRSSPESEPSVTQQSDTTTTKPGVVVKDYKGNIVCEYMGKPGDIDVKPVKTIEKEDSTITRAFSPDKDDKDDLIKIQVKPFEEKITRAFSPEKQEKLSIEKTIEPTSKVLQPVDDKITRAFSSEKDDTEKDDWIEGLKSDILPSTDEDETSKKSPKKDDPSKERFSPTKSPIDDKIGKRDEPSDQPDDDDDEPVEEMTIDPKQPQKQANDIVAKTKKAKDPNKRLIIRFIIRRPDGESIEEMDIDPQTPDEDIDQIIRDLLQDMPSKIKDPKKDKITFKIFKRRQHEPTEDESIGEFDIDPKNPERIADEIITKTIKPEKAQSKKDQKQKIVLRFVIVKPDGSQAIEDRIVDPSASDKQVDEIVREILRQAPKKLKDPKDKLKFKVLRRKPKIKNDQQMIGSKTTASDPLRKDKPETHRSELADLMKSADDEDELVDEIDIDPKQPEKNVDEIIKKTTKSKEPNKRIVIRFVVRSLEGTSIEEMDIDPETPDEDIDQIILELLRDAPTRVKDPENDKISFKILKRKQSAPTEDEQIGEFDIDPKNPERIANEIIKKAIKPEKAQSKKDPKQKIVLRFVIVKPDGSQAIEDRVMDPDTCDKDADEIIREILRQTPKKLRHPNDRSIFRVLRRKPIKDVSDATKPEPKSAESKILMKKDAKKTMENQKFPKQELEQEVEEEIEEEEGPTDDEPVEEFDIDQKSPMKNVAEIVGKTINAKEPGKRVVLRFIIRTPDEGDSIEEMEIDPETSDEDLDEIIRELLNDSPSKIQDPKKDKIIFKIMKRTPKDQEPTEDEQIAEFNIDPKSPEKIAKDIISKAIQPLTLKPSKDPRERIVLRFIVRRPDGSESIEELVIDPRMTDNDIEGVIRDILRQTPGKLRDPRDKTILRVINRQPQQNKQQPKPQIDDEQQKITRPTSKPMSETQKPSKSRMNDEEEPVGDFEIDPQKPEKDIDQIIQKITSRARDPTKKLILRLIRQIPDRSDLVEEHLIQSETPESDIAKILGQLPKKVTDTREKTLINFVLKPRDNHRSPDDLPLTRDPNDNVIIRIVVQKPNNERSIEEFQLPTGSSKKDIENLIRQVNQSTTPKIKEPNTQIITRVVKQTPDGQESIKEYHVDQRTAPTDIDEIIRKNIRPKQRRIITRVVIRKPDGTETVEEIEIDPDEENIDEVIRRKLGETASKITGPAKISTRLIRQKPDGSEEEEEDLDLYPEDNESDDDNYDNDEQLEEFEIDPKSPEKIIDSIVNRMLRSKVPDRRLVIRYVIIRPEEGELIEEMIVDPRTTDGEIREIIHEILMETPSKIKDPRDRVVFRIIHRPSKHEQQQQTAEDQDETIGEFEINPKFPETNADEIIHRATTSQQRQPKEQIIIRFIIIRPGFGEQIEELEIDPQLDDDNIGHIIRDMLRQAPAKLRDPQDRIVFAIVKRKRKQKQQKTRDIDDMIRQAIRSSVPKPSCRLSTTGAEETIGEIEIIPETSQQAIGDFVRRTIHSPNSRIGDSNNVRIIIRILSRKSTIGDVDDLIEQFEMSPATGEKDIDAVVRKILRTITTRSPEPNERIILRIIKRRQGSQDSLDDEPESATGDDIDEIIRRSLKTQTSTIRDPSGKIITRVVRLKPGGEEPVKEVEMDPKCTEGDIDEIIREAIQTSRNKYPSGKMITRIIRMKSGGEESIEELAMDPETPQVDLDDMIRKAVRTTISRIKDSNSKMITRIVRLKPGGSESIEELEVDPELQEEENGDNNDIREKNRQHLPYTKIITRIVRQNADDREEILEEFETIPESADSDIDDAIRESILSATSLIQDPNTKIITRVIRLKPCGEKSIEEFEMDPECSDIDSDIDDAIRKAIRTRSLTIKDSTGKIITRVVRKKSDGQESIEDLDDEQQQSAKTHEQPEGIGQYVRKTIRDTISPVKDKAGDLISRAFKQQQHQMTTTTLTTTQTAGIKHRPATKTTTNESFGFMRKTYSSAVKEQPRDMKGKSPPFRAGLPTRDIHGNIIPSTTTTTTRISKPTTTHSITAEARRPEPRNTSLSIQERVGNKFGKFVTPSSSSASSSSLSSRDSRSKSKTPPTADNRPRMTFSLRSTPERESQTGQTKISRPSIQIKKSSDSKGFIKVDEQQQQQTQQHGTRIPVFTSPGGGGVLKDSTSLSPKAIQQEIGNDFDSSNPKTRRRNNRTTTTTTTNKQQKK